jgi:four helix bundle protein
LQIEYLRFASGRSIIKKTINKPRKMKSNELIKRTKEFAHRCIKLAMALPETALGKHIRGQLIRCSTSVASNYRATCLSQSKASFVAKISIVLEETDESAFWLEFIIDESLLKEKQVKPLLREAEELTAIFASSRITASTRN